MLRRILYAGVVSGSALLVFLIQPMMGKALLPWFGGSAGVWTTAMLFFQAVLLLGYAYAHWIQRQTATRQAAMHGLLVAFSAAAVFDISAAWQPAADGAPVLSILSLLAAKIGLPYFVLSSTGPLVQAWWVRTAAMQPPYWLFAVSNTASLAALLSYPFLIEPLIATRSQLRIWSGMYLAFAAAMCVMLWGYAAASGRREVEEELPGWRKRWLWVALAACPSALWMAMANVLSQDIAPAPLLWVLPLSIYLLTFILCFQSESWYRPAALRIALPLSWAAICYGLVRQSRDLGLKPMLLLLGGSLFVCCMFCHGELARQKPKATQATSFYLWVSGGGALGGVFVGLIAPHVFDRFLELPVAVVACVVLGMRLLYGYPMRQVARLVVIGGIAFVFASQMNTAGSIARLRVRNFYGALQVSDVGSGDAELRVLSSGPVHHGTQFLAPGKSRLATAYYGWSSGVGRAIAGMQNRQLRIGVIGLGAGTLAAYGRAGDSLRFYEINPAVIGIARTEFRYLRESRAAIGIVEGDGRLALARETGERFDLLVLDAFSGDSIPTHLLTREAFALYFARLKTEGEMAVHITNQYVDLASVVRAAAEEAGWRVEVMRSAPDPSMSLFDTTWVLLKRGGVVKRQPAVWSDGYSNLLQVLK